MNFYNSEFFVRNIFFDVNYEKCLKKWKLRQFKQISKNFIIGILCR